jgi:DUF1365 family protein
MNSALYECRVMHHRLSPKEHRFTYRIFMFCLDLAELDLLSDQLRWFSRNRGNLYSFWDRDHLVFSSPDIRENIREYVRTQGCSAEVTRVMLVTLPRVLGYVFNPVSFYFCFSEDNQALGAVVQVGNTFGEMKLYYLPERTPGEVVRFVLQETKYFYVSPFMDHDLKFAFDLQVPGAKMVMQIDDYQDTQRVLHTTLTGERRELSDRNLLRFLWKYPLVTLKVIGGIHWEAFRIWRKGLPYHRKAENPDLQRNIHKIKTERKRGRANGVG